MFFGGANINNFGEKLLRFTFFIGAIVVIVAIVVIDEGDAAGKRWRLFFCEQKIQSSVVYGKGEKV